MNRRGFLKFLGAVPALAAIAPSLLADTVAPEDDWEQVYNRDAYRNARTGDEVSSYDVALAGVSPTPVSLSTLNEILKADYLPALNDHLYSNRVFLKSGSPKK